MLHDEQRQARDARLAEDAAKATPEPAPAPTHAFAPLDSNDEAVFADAYSGALAAGASEIEAKEFATKTIADAATLTTDEYFAARQAGKLDGIRKPRFGLGR